MKYLQPTVGVRVGVPVGLSVGGVGDEVGVSVGNVIGMRLETRRVTFLDQTAPETAASILSTGILPHVEASVLYAL